MMTHANVSSSVLSIIASFTNGLDVFKKLREKGKRKKHGRPEERGDTAALDLSRSLRRGPEDIGREYEHDVHRAGEYFTVGDPTAQTSLAEILLRLNSGIVNIINTFLSRDKHDRQQLDFRSLTELSERSRFDTVNVLRQLYQRMMSRRPLPALEARETIDFNEARKAPRRVPSKRSKIRGPTVARVTIQDSSKPATLAMIKPGMKKKSHSASSSNLTKTTSSPASILMPSSPPPEYSRSSRPVNHRSITAPELPKPKKKPSSADVKSPIGPSRPDYSRASKSTPGLLLPTYEELEEPFRIAPKATPLQSRELHAYDGYRRRKDTPTFYSVASASTKLGEIPLHKWVSPYDFDAMSVLNREAMQNGWPVADAQGELVDKKKRRNPFFRLFKKKEALT